MTEDLTSKAQKIYNSNQSKYNQVREEALFIINNFISNSNIKIHSIQSRVKEFASLIKKAEGLEILEESKVFEQITDIVGVRIICLFISNIDQLSQLVRKNFIVIKEDNKLDGSDISSFGYFSVHFIVKLSNEYKGPRYDNIKEVVFELQLRTISMDAWANISHYLDYKSEVEIPKDLKRDFHALSGLFYVADTHFEMFFKSKMEQSQLAEKEIKEHIELDINYETLEAYVNDRFGDRQTPGSEQISRLTRELVEIGYKSISEIDKQVSEYLKKYSLMPQLNRVGAIRVIIRKMDPKYEKYLKGQKK